MPEVHDPAGPQDEPLQPIPMPGGPPEPPTTIIPDPQPVRPDQPE